MVEKRQAAQDVRRHVALSQLIVAVDLLGTMQDFRHFCLCQIMVFPQFPNTFVQYGDHLKHSVQYRKMQY